MPKWYTPYPAIACVECIKRCFLIYQDFSVLGQFQVQMKPLLKL